MGFWMKLIVSYLISFPLMMGEGWDGGGHVKSPSHLNPPPLWGEEVIFCLNWGITSRFLYIDYFAENSLAYSWFKSLFRHKIHIDPQKIW